MIIQEPQASLVEPTPISIRSPAKREMKTESGWVRPDLPATTSFLKAQNLSQQPTAAVPDRPTREHFRIWDLTLLWCFAFVLWSFLPAPSPAAGELPEKSHEVQLEDERGLASATISGHVE